MRPAGHVLVVVIDCESGVTVEVCDEEELLDELLGELLEHIAVAHKAAMRREPAALIAEAYEV